MLKDTPYNTLKQDERAYEIMLLRDRDGSSFVNIAAKHKISTQRALQIYNKMKFKQKWLYINHISIALGHADNSQVKKIYEQADECYRDRQYACAYLEKEYKDILTEYRNGEPGMPEKFLKKIPPLKIKLSIKTIANIIEMREAKKMPFAKIAKRFHLTRQKAEYTYNQYYHAKLLSLMAILKEKTNSPQEKNELWDYCLNNRYSSKVRYERLVRLASGETESSHCECGNTVAIQQLYKTAMSD